MKREDIKDIINKKLKEIEKNQIDLVKSKEILNETNQEIKPKSIDKTNN